MNFIVGVISLLRAIPDLLKIAKEIMGFLHEISDYVERLKKTKELKEAVQEARDTGNTAALDKLFNGGLNAPTPQA